MQSTHTAQHFRHLFSPKHNEEKAPEATLLCTNCSFRGFHGQKMFPHIFHNINYNPQRSKKAGAHTPVLDILCLCT